MEVIDLYDVFDSWGYTLSKISQSMNELFTERLSIYSIDAREYGILSVVYKTPKLTQKEIGIKMVVDRTTMMQLIDVLEKKKLINRESNPKDRRQNLITLTVKGREIVEKMWIEMEEVEKEVIGNMTLAQKKVFERINAAMNRGERK